MRNGLSSGALLWTLLACIGLVAGYFVWSPANGAAPFAAEQSAPDLDQQAEAALRTVDEALAKFPPMPDSPLERRTALAMLDAVLREPHAPWRAAVQTFFHRRIEQALAQMKETAPRPDATVWHIYNHGFVVRTPEATLCFDLVRARYLPGFALSESLMRELVQQCDVLFVSHVHADHAEDFVAQTFIDQGKPVVAPAQIGYPDPLYDKITHFAPNAEKAHRLPVRRGEAIIEVVVFPGHQDTEIDNNVVLVTTPNGLSVAHTGDQWNTADFEWIDRVAHRHRVDILLPNDWTYDIARLVRGFNPAVTIPGHANELGHMVAKRQPYMLSFQRKSGSSRFGGNETVGYPHPLVVLAWGESYEFQRPRRPKRQAERSEARSLDP